MYKSKDINKLTKSDINKQMLKNYRFPDWLTVKTVKEKILPKIDYEWEVRGVQYDPKRQRHVKTYKMSDIINYYNKKVSEYYEKKKH